MASNERFNFLEEKIRLNGGLRKVSNEVRNLGKIPAGDFTS